MEWLGCLLLVFSSDVSVDLIQCMFLFSQVYFDGD